MLLAWIPVFGLLQRRILSVVGPWAYLSAVFYFLNVVVSLLIANPVLFRFALLGITLLMLLPLAWHVRRRGAAVVDNHGPMQTTRCGTCCAGWPARCWWPRPPRTSWAMSRWRRCWSRPRWTAATPRWPCWPAARCCWRCSRCCWPGRRVSRLTARYSASLVPSVISLGRNLLVLGWLIFTLQAFRVYRPLSTFVLSVLTHEFKLGELTLSLGSVVAFAAGHLGRVLAGQDHPPGAGRGRAARPVAAARRGQQHLLAELLRILFLGLLAALAAAGFQVGQLTLIFGALGVGIGIGLQDVVRNFVSGLILMFERPIQRGDTVEVAGMEGTVREIGLRATIVTTFDGADVVVPNGMLLADKLVNWTLNGTRRRVTMNVSTSFAAAPQRTIEVLVDDRAQRARASRRRRRRRCIMTGLAPGELLFNVRVWTTDFSDWIAGAHRADDEDPRRPGRGRHRGAAAAARADRARPVAAGGPGTGPTEAAPG